MACAIAFERGPSITTDAVLVATDAAAPTWFAGTGLAHDARGFLAVGPTLQTVNDPDVFAAGDCAALIENPREKAGVFAVRAGPPLAANLRRRASGRAVRAWRPQRQHLALISTGERYAVASRLRALDRYVLAQLAARGKLERLATAYDEILEAVGASARWTPTPQK